MQGVCLVHLHFSVPLLSRCRPEPPPSIACALDPHLHAVPGQFRPGTSAFRLVSVRYFSWWHLHFCHPSSLHTPLAPYFLGFWQTHLHSIPMQCHPPCLYSLGWAHGEIRRFSRVTAGVLGRSGTRSKGDKDRGIALSPHRAFPVQGETEPRGDKSML